MITVSEHARERFAERFGVLSLEECWRRATDAMEKGILASVEKRRYRGQECDYLIIDYHGGRWIFSKQGRLVTLYPFFRKRRR